MVEPRYTRLSKKSIVGTRDGGVNASFKCRRAAPEYTLFEYSTDCFIYCDTVSNPESKEKCPGGCAQQIRKLLFRLRENHCWRIWLRGPICGALSSLNSLGTLSLYRARASEISFCTKLSSVAVEKNEVGLSLANLPCLKHLAITESSIDEIKWNPPLEHLYIRNSAHNFAQRIDTLFIGLRKMDVWGTDYLYFRGTAVLNNLIDLCLHDVDVPEIFGLARCSCLSLENTNTKKIYNLGSLKKLRVKDFAPEEICSVPLCCDFALRLPEGNCTIAADSYILGRKIRAAWFSDGVNIAPRINDGPRNLFALCLEKLEPEALRAANELLPISSISEISRRIDACDFCCRRKFLYSRFDPSTPEPNNGWRKYFPRFLCAGCFFSAPPLSGGG